jgi:hypothetical protein
MMRTIARYFLVIALTLIIGGCGSKTQTTGKTDIPEPDYVGVQHILIAFQGTTNKTGVTRTKEEAQSLADELYQRATAGDDFDELVRTYSDDSYPGIYDMANFGKVANKSMLQYDRKEMAPAFGDISFSLTVGEVGLAQYDKKNCKFGWHVIKRLK